MPYIPDKDRYSLLYHERIAATAGELNYQFTQDALRYLLVNGLNYQHINDVLGALEGAKLELQRRVIGPYEDTKVAQNGDLENYQELRKVIYG